MNPNPAADQVHVMAQDPDIYCPEWWNRMFLGQVNTEFEYKPCCVYRGMLTRTTIDPTQIYQHYHDTIAPHRERNLRGERDPACAQCWEAEDRGQVSSRLWKIQEQGRQSVDINTHLDLNLSNLCNLSCAICGPWNSSTWNSRSTRRLYPVAPQYERSRPVIDDPQLFRRLRSIQIQGGEPFMDPNYSTFFENMGRHRDYSDLTITIFTNGTRRPSEKFLTILNSCREVRVFFSIDDQEHRFEYQRSGALWLDVVDNLRWFRDNTGPGWHFNFNPTVSMLNIYYLPELMEFFQQQFPHWPVSINQFNNQPGLLARCAATGMTAWVRDIILARTAHIPALAFLTHYISVIDDPWSPFLDYIERYDEMIQQSYELTHWDFYRLIT